MRIMLRRGTPGALRTETFDLPDLPGASVSNVLQYVNRHLDGGVAYYLSCRRGLCVCCVVRVDGKIERACVTPARDGMTIEPIRADLLVKDTVVHLGVPPECFFDPRDAAPLIAGADARTPPSSRGDTACD
jgi:succinate dehydrogenase/fumarate reductase-like Fe-S protein